MHSYCIYNKELYIYIKKQTKKPETMITKEDIKVGFTFKAYYNDGTLVGERKVIRVTEKSVWVKHSESYAPRYSYNTILNYFEEGYFKL